MQISGHRSHVQRGIAYLWMLLAIALLALGIGHALDMTHQQIQRQKEQDLLYVGEKFQQAIQAYYLASPGDIKRFPSTLADLERDNRMLAVRRYIRQLYPDPMTGHPVWGLIRSRDGGIAGIYSLSNKTPIKRTGFPPELEGFEDAPTYRDWKFSAHPENQVRAFNPPYGVSRNSVASAGLER